ncbi:cupin domain-containing protein [Bacillus canaveralius]|uniref:Cupin domain-containing protein n=1 Tax=Bacillus canaveralius TaxID=1403243 RepID=A0A2N5GIX1_9BACI|nr:MULTISPECIES: cupin domain-containing protein [Bacillus]PLR80925.1 cupin domain-containing protein [Bacillus canaveralius]PLR81687.1 cupin domain-containing protein [Bacillus sp. V33-4]PLR91213.1 cupin domain-containing protein [Bacillus canaveralius]RSK52677.1 cupin domain-containing protein [Bacillus canaveralius]
MEKKSAALLQEFNENHFTKRVIFNKGESTVFLLNFMAGQYLPPHKHPGAEVYLMVLQGNGVITIDGVKTEVTEKDVILADGAEELSFQHTGADPTCLYVMLNKIPDERFVQDI